MEGREIDREKVIKGMECCNFSIFMEKCGLCPYDGDDCFMRLKEDALELMRKTPEVIRCADCKYCFDVGSDPMEPYDGESEWYCARWDRETSAYGTDPYRFYCADAERREDDGDEDRILDRETR